MDRVKDAIEGRTHTHHTMTQRWVGGQTTTSIIDQTKASHISINKTKCDTVDQKRTKGTPETKENKKGKR